MLMAVSTALKLLGSPWEYVSPLVLAVRVSVSADCRRRRPPGLRVRAEGDTGTGAAAPTMPQAAPREMSVREGWESRWVWSTVESWWQEEG